MLGRITWIRSYVAFALFLLAACSGGEAATEAPEPTAPASPTTETPRPVAAEPALHLPPVASPVAVLDDIAVYFAEEDARQLVMVTDYSGYDDADGPTELVAYDLETGEERWRVPAGWAEGTPHLCVRERFIYLTTFEGVDQYDRDGELVGLAPSGGLERTITTAGDLRLTADPSGGDIELVTIVLGDHRSRWRQPLAAFGPGAEGYGPDGGWTGHIDESSEQTLFWVGSLPPPGVYGDPDFVMSPDELEAEARAGHLIGLADEDGTRLLGLTGVYDCRAMPFSVEEFWTCEAVEVAAVEDHTGDGIADPEPFVQRMVRRSAANPEGDLVVDLPTPIPYYGGGIEATSDPDRFLLTPHADAGEPMVLDVSAGEVSAVDDAPELLASCELPEEREATLADDPLLVELRTFDRERRDYVAVHGPLGVCTLDGTPVDPRMALGRGPIAPWFGIAGEVTGGDDGEATTARRWVIWTETDRVLRIVRLEPDPSATEES